jgi:hypothetical protein
LVEDILFETRVNIFSTILSIRVPIAANITNSSSSSSSSSSSFSALQPLVGFGFLHNYQINNGKGFATKVFLWDKVVSLKPNP